MGGKRGIMADGRAKRHRPPQGAIRTIWVWRHLLNVTAIENQTVYGVSANPHLPPDTLSVDLHSVLRIDYPSTFVKPNAMGWFFIGLSATAFVIAAIAISNANIDYSK
jgi:hypothetical protein